MDMNRDVKGGNVVTAACILLMELTTRPIPELEAASKSLREAFSSHDAPRLFEEATRFSKAAREAFPNPESMPESTNLCTNSLMMALMDFAPDMFVLPEPISWADLAPAIEQNRQTLLETGRELREQNGKLYGGDVPVPHNRNVPDDDDPEGT